MEKRTFLQGAMGISAAAALAPAGAQAMAPAQPVLLTVSGRVTRPNRGGLDEALDQMMHKQGLAFERARTFTYSELDALPSSEINPVIEYDAKRHKLRGPALLRVLELAGAPADDNTTVLVRAVDGYAAPLTLAEIKQMQYLLATRIDGVPLALGSLGPLWGVFDPARLADLADKPLPAQFARCPWGVYSVHLP